MFTKESQWHYNNLESFDFYLILVLRRKKKNQFNKSTRVVFITSKCALKIVLLVARYGLAIYRGGIFPTVPSSLGALRQLRATHHHDLFFLSQHSLDLWIFCLDRGICRSSYLMTFF
jgi:hypothetical protein